MSNVNQRQTEIIAFASGKGGTGKTSISAALGYALTLCGHKVLLLDTDRATDGFSLFILGPKGMHQLGDYRPENTFSGILEHFELKNELFCKSREVNRSEPTDHRLFYDAIISAIDLYGDPPVSGRSVSSLNRQTPRPVFQRAVLELFKRLRQGNTYDYILVDTRGGFSYESTDVVAAADSFVLVTEATTTNFYQDRNLIARVSATAAQIRTKPLLRAVIVNKAIQGDELSYRSEVKEAFGIKFEDTFSIALDRDAAAVYKMQKVIYLDAPASQFAYDTLVAFSHILRTVTSQWEKTRAVAWNELVARVDAAIKTHNAELEAEAAREAARLAQLEATEKERVALMVQLETIREAHGQEKRRQEILVEELRTQAGQRDEALNRERVLASEHARDQERLQHTVSEAEKRVTEEAESRHRERIRWIVVILLITALASGAGYLSYRSLERVRKEQDLSSQQAQREASERSIAYLERAKSKLAQTNNPKSTVLALHDLSIALRLNSANSEAATLTADLLSKRSWCPPVTPTLRYPGTSPLVAATLGLNGQIFAVSSDARILTWNEQGSVLTPLQFLSQSASGARGTEMRVSSAAFDESGQKLLVTFATAQNAAIGQVWTWSKQTKAFEYNNQQLQLTGAPLRNAVWSPDGSLLIVYSGRWTETSSQVFSCQTGKCDELSSPKPFGDSGVSSACFSARDKIIATASQTGLVQLWTWDGKVIKRVDQPGGFRRSFEIGARPSFMAFSSDAMHLVTSVFGEGLRIWDLRTEDKGVVISPPTSQDQFMRCAFNSENRLAVTSLTGRAVISDSDRLDRPIAEPMSVDGSVVMASFSREGRQIMTLSGAFWMALDTIRIWDIPTPRDSSKAPETYDFNKKSAPPWLADLAEAVAGVRSSSIEEDSVPITVDQIRKKHAADAANGEYSKLWISVIPPGAPGKDKAASETPPSYPTQGHD